MWSAVPGVGDLSSGSDSEGEKSTNSADQCSHGPWSPKTPTASSDNSGTAPPRDVSEQHWQTFCQLKRRREDLSQSQSQGRPKKQKRKHQTDQEDVLSSGTAQPLSSLPSSSSSDFPGEKSVLTGDTCTSSSTKPHSDSASPGSAKTTSPTQEQKEHWAELKKHLHVNEHIHQGIDHGQLNPHKSGLEKQLDKAVEEGSFDQAEELSDQLATRDLACKIAKSADARDYLKWKEAEETRRKAKRKKKKLNWGFEAKERWQMKGNM